jgi:hypothetical protein
VENERSGGRSDCDTADPHDGGRQPLMGWLSRRGKQFNQAKVHNRRSDERESDRKADQKYRDSSDCGCPYGIWRRGAELVPHDNGS